MTAHREMTDPEPVIGAPDIAVSPAEGPAGGPVTITASLPPGAKARTVQIADETGAERLRFALSPVATAGSTPPVPPDPLPDAPEGVAAAAPPAPLTGQATAQAPATVGAHRWQARCIAEDGHAGPPAPVVFTTCAHRVNVVVWDVPTTVEPGQTARVRIGARCTAGCATAGWTLVLRDGDGKVHARAIAGNSPWRGTEALHHAEIPVAAGEEPGMRRWRVEAIAPDRASAPDPTAPAFDHDVRPAEFGLRTVDPPRHTVAVRVRNRRDGSPVAGARVVIHPYRTETDGNGDARVPVAPGRYTLYVSGRGFIPFRLPGEVHADIRVNVQLDEDRPLSEAELWG